MPGFTGFVELSPSSNPTELLEGMIATLRVSPVDILGTHSDQPIHFGSVQLGTVKQALQPFWTEDRCIAMVMAGEIFDYGDQAYALRKLGYSMDPGNPLQFIASLYREKGDEFVQSLNGAFAIAIWDDKRNKLILANDRLGYVPLYFTQHPERFGFATGIRALLADLRVPRAVNILAMAQFLTFDHVLGNETFLRDIHLLPPASILTLAEGQVKVRTYWQLEFPDQYPYQSEGDYQEELLSLLRQAVARQLHDAPAGIMLSGGLDSRVVFALLTEKKPAGPLRAFTFGVPDCDDLRFARELAKQQNIPHEYYPLRPDYLIHRAEMGIELTDGMENVVHMHTLDNLPAQAEHAPIIYKGFLGDALAGYFSFRDLLSSYGSDDLKKILLERYPVVFSPDSHAQLFSPNVTSQLQNAVIETACEELTQPGTHRPAADLFFQFDLRQRQRRLTLNGVQMVRSLSMVRTPFYDNDLLDFMLRLPQGYRLERRLITSTFVKAFPNLAKIPSTATGYPMMPCRREMLMRMNEHLRWGLRSIGLRWIPIRQKRHYAAYNDWLRGDLRQWAEGILSSEQFHSRGIFNRDYIQQLLREHMAGQRHYQKLGALISIELWHQKYLD